jgi:hypothetical protein
LLAANPAIEDISLLQVGINLGDVNTTLAPPVLESNWYLMWRCVAVRGVIFGDSAKLSAPLLSSNTVR